MKVKFILISLMFITFLVTGCSTLGHNMVTSNDNSVTNINNLFSSLYQKELQSVVQIEIATNEQGEGKQGSGVIISKDGYIITNNHVIEDAKEIIILTYDLKDYNAILVGTDVKTDIALLKINSEDVFVAAKIGNSDKTKIGEWVTALGSPFGMQNSITAGIISGKNRQDVMEDYYTNFIQTDTAINPGNSGGPLFNLKGEVIGINTMIIKRNNLNSNMGFSVPINTAMFIVERLKKYGEVVRGYMGIIVQDINSEVKKLYNLSSRKGAIIKDVSKDSPADRAGLKTDDIIIEFNNKKIIHMHELIFEISMAQIGKKLEVVILRNNEKRILTVILEKINPNNVISVRDFQKRFGYDTTVIDKDLASILAEKNRVKAEQLIEKIIITEVVPEGSAYLSGLRKNDIIVTIGSKPIRSPEEYGMTILKLSLDKPFLMTVLRNGDIRYLVFSIKAGNLS